MSSPSHIWQTLDDVIVLKNPKILTLFLFAKLDQIFDTIVNFQSRNKTFKLLIKYSSKLQIMMHVGGAHYTDTNEHLSIWNFIMCKTENELFIRICVQMKNVQIELNCYFFQHVHARKSLSFSHECKWCVCVCERVLFAQCCQSCGRKRASYETYIHQSSA